MQFSSPATPSPIDPWRWRIVWLLFLATLINYTDRLALGNTQRYLLPEFEPDPAKQNAVYANVLFAFGITFGLFQVVAGFLIDRFSLRYLYLGAVLIWSAAGVFTGFVPAGAIGMLMACRIGLGIGEAFNWPCAVACIRRIIPRDSRGLANGIFHSGASIGAVATPFVVLALVDTTTGAGWRTVFLVVGTVGFLWAALWMASTGGSRATEIDGEPKPDPGTETPIGPPPSIWAVFGTKLFWICLTTGVCVNLCWHFYNSWFPRYLTEDLQVGARTEQLILAGFYICADLGSMASGWTTRKLARSGFTVEKSRKLAMWGLATVVFLATVPASLLPGDLLAAKVLFFFVVAAAAMGGFAVFFALAQDIVGKHTAQILGVCGCMSWLVISGVTKVIGDFGLAGPGRYAILFLAVGCVPLIAAAVGQFWREPASTASA